MSMDDVLPLFLYVIVRARIRHLGAEVRFLDDFLQTDTMSGESRVLLTTMRAAYYQLQFEAPELRSNEA
jgi:amyotrophic lateral sclerosis 2 protein